MNDQRRLGASSTATSRAAKLAASGRFAALACALVLLGLVGCSGEARVVDATGAPADLGPLAGEYRVSPTTTWQTLSLGPDGFRYRMGGCMGLYEDRTGRVRVDGERLEMLPDESADYPTTTVFGPTLVSLTWGARRYLVPEEQLGEFCNAVNAGHEARAGSATYFVLGEGDAQPVGGLPEVPAAYAERLLAAPVEARIAALRGDGDDRRVALDAGSAAGLQAGMRLHRVGGDGSFLVESVDEASCEARAEDWTVAPAVGEAVSTRDLGPGR